MHDLSLSDVEIVDPEKSLELDISVQEVPPPTPVSSSESSAPVRGLWSEKDE